MYVANAGPFLCGCIHYNTDELNVAMIVAIVVLLGVPLILHILVAVVYVCKRCDAAKQRHVTDSVNNDVEMSPAVASSVRPAER